MLRLVVVRAVNPTGRVAHVEIHGADDAHLGGPTAAANGALDVNGPIAGGEQMDQALKLLGVDTQLVIYPEQFHGISQPSYRRDIAARCIAWFDRYLKAP